MATTNQPGCGSLVEHMTRQVKQSVHRSRDEFQQIFHTASTGMRVIDNNYTILKANKAFLGMAAADGESVEGKKCFDVFAGDTCHTPECPLRRIQDGADIVEFEVEKKRSDGDLLTCALTATPFTGHRGERLGIVESFKDISELKKTQHILQSERNKLRNILAHMVEGVGIINPDHTIAYENRQLENMIGPCEGQPCYAALKQLDAPCEHCAMSQVFQTGKLVHAEFAGAEGKVYEQIYTGFTDADGQLKILLQLRDITEEKRTLAAAMCSEQLAAMGELAASVAHEINNPINGIINLAQIALNKNKQDHALTDTCARIMKEGNRITNIVACLLSFARRDNPKKAPVRIADILSDALFLAAAQLRKDGIQVEYADCPSLPPLVARGQQLQQVFINMISNARYALNQKYPAPGPNKKMSIRCDALKKNGADHVQVVFADTGCGISDPDINKLIQPFFTTKPRGQGTGLGLSISHNIVVDHGGTMSIESKEGHFTRVTIELPAGGGGMSPRRATHTVGR